MVRLDSVIAFLLEVLWLLKICQLKRFCQLGEHLDSDEGVCDVRAEFYDCVGAPLVGVFDVLLASFFGGQTDFCEDTLERSFLTYHLLIISKVH